MAESLPESHNLWLWMWLMFVLGSRGNTEKAVSLSGLQDFLIDVVVVDCSDCVWMRVKEALCQAGRQMIFVFDRMVKSPESRPRCQNFYAALAWSLCQLETHMVVRCVRLSPFSRMVAWYIRMLAEPCRSQGGCFVC
jgi:hypothetical protein